VQWHWNSDKTITLLFQLIQAPSVKYYNKGVCKNSMRFIHFRFDKNRKKRCLWNS